MFSRTYKVDTFSRWSPRVGGHNGHVKSYKVLCSHRSPYSIIILGLGPVPSANSSYPFRSSTLSLSLALSSPFNFLRCVPSPSRTSLLPVCPPPPPLFPALSFPNRSFSFVPSPRLSPLPPPHFRKPRTRHVFILSRSVRRLFHRLPSGIMHLKRRRLKDRRLCVPCSEFLDIN